MRYMLGKDYDQPSILVEVEKEVKDGFHFWVVNGAWTGKYTYTNLEEGSIFIDYTKESVENVFVLSTNQDRLRGDYQDVFDNWENESYVAPIPKVVQLPDDWDDDIAF